MKVLCVDNLPRIYNDGSSDGADEYLTIGKTYDARICGENKKYIYIEVSDLGGFPKGHRFHLTSRFKFVDDIREEKINDLLN
jgi:hypothetical protein